MTDSNTTSTTSTSTPEVPGTSTSPNVPSTSESPSQGNVSAPGTQPETTPEGSPKREAWRKLGIREAKARAAEKEAKQRQAQWEADKTKWEEERTQINDLFSGLKESPEKIKALLSKSGLDINDFNRAFIGLEPEATPIDKQLQQLKDKIETKEQAETKAKEDAAKASQEATQKAAQVRDLSRLKGILDAEATTDETAYEQIRTHNQYSAVLADTYEFIKANWDDIKQLTPEEEPEVIKAVVKHHADIIEQRLTDRALEVYNKINASKKLQKLMGINSNNINNPSKDGKASSNHNPALDPEAVQILEQLQASPDRRPSKFITHEASITSTPVLKEQPAPSQSWAMSSGEEIANLLKKYGH